MKVTDQERLNYERFLEKADVEPSIHGFKHAIVQPLRDACYLHAAPQVSNGLPLALEVLSSVLSIMPPQAEVSRPRGRGIGELRGYFYGPCNTVRNFLYNLHTVGFPWLAIRGAKVEYSESRNVTGDDVGGVIKRLRLNSNYVTLQEFTRAIRHFPTMACSEDCSRATLLVSVYGQAVDLLDFGNTLGNRVQFQPDHIDVEEETVWEW